MRGARCKAEGGLDRVLFVRADTGLVERLEALRVRRCAEQPGVTLSTADLVRSILWAAVDKELR